MCVASYDLAAQRCRLVVECSCRVEEELNLFFAEVISDESGSLNALNLEHVGVVAVRRPSRHISTGRRETVEKVNESSCCVRVQKSVKLKMKAADLELLTGHDVGAALDVCRSSVGSCSCCRCIAYWT